MTDQAHPIDIDLERILPILAREIYTSPYAFLRENVQNAFDAIRMQRYREKVAPTGREHRIVVTLESDRLSISDSGIGMTKADLVDYFWSIGKSGKHTPEARAAGVVGTFGIGGMANFGVCSRLEVMTRTREEQHSVVSFAERNRLSAKDDCVFYRVGPPELEPGTTISGTLVQGVTSEQIIAYLEPIVRFLDVPIDIGGTALVQEPFPKVRREDGATRTAKSGPLEATLFVRALRSGQAEVEVDNLSWNGKEIEVSAVFQTSARIVSAYQHGFMLANVPITTVFGLGGVINSPILRPTAGREAVTDESRTLVQTLLGATERALAEHIASISGLPQRFSLFYRYVAGCRCWDLAGSATVRVYGSDQRVPLESMRGSISGRVFFARDDHDRSITQAYAEQKKTVVLLSSDGYRQKVERQYLMAYCNAAAIEDRVTCLKVVEDLSVAQMVLQFKLQTRLRTQFLIDELSVKAGELSHGAMLWTPSSGRGPGKVLFVDFRHPQIERLLQLRASLSFDAVFDIFIRDSVLPHLEDSYSELRKRDFDALLRKLQSTVEYFEIDPGDVGRIQQLAMITNMSPEDVATVFGGRRTSVAKSTSIGREDVGSVTQQVKQVIEQSKGRSAQEIRQELEIRLLETDLEAKILDARELEPEFGLARYYLSLTRDAHILYRRVFVERKPLTDFSWGGHKAGYLFYSRGDAVVYYDIQFEDLLGESGHERTGTVTLEHAPLIAKNNVFLAIPEAFERHLVPLDRTLKFTVRHQILGVDSSGGQWA